MSYTNKANHKNSNFKHNLKVWNYLNGRFHKHQDTRTLESSKYLIKRQKKQALRKPLVFPVSNPDVKIRNEVNAYGNKQTGLSFKAAKKQYLAHLNKKAQEDYDLQLRAYKKWKILWPFYVFWIKFLRLFNLDFVLNKDTRYEFSNEQLELLNYREANKKKWYEVVPIVCWIWHYISYLKVAILTRRYQRNNWIAFWSFSVLLLISLAIIITFAVYVKTGQIVLLPFNSNLSLPNFFATKTALITSTIALSSTAMILFLIPLVLLVSVWLSNITDINTNLVFVLYQQASYLIATCFMLISVCLELTIYFAH